MVSAITENEDKLLWNPYLISEQDSEEYLSKSQESLQGGNGVTSLPLGAHIRDDEQVKFSCKLCLNTAPLRINLPHILIE